MSKRAARLRPLGLVVGLALTAPLAAPRASWAQPSALQRETARGLMKQGDERFAAGDYPHALEAYQGAHALVAVPTTGIALAVTHEKLGHLVEAHDIAIEVMRMRAGDSEPPPFQDARRRAAALATSVAPRIPSLTIRVDAPTRGVIVTLDGKRLAAAAVGAAWKVDPGEHVVVVSADGYEPAQKSITIPEGSNERIAFALAPSAPGAKRDATPVSHSRVSPLAYVGFAVGGVALVGGAITGGIAWSQASSLRTECHGNECPPSHRSDLDRANALATTSNVLFAVAAAGVVVGVVALVFLGKPANAQAGARSGAPPIAVRF